MTRVGRVSNPPYTYICPKNLACPKPDRITADMQMIVRWQTIAVRYPVASSLASTAVFTAAVFWENAVNVAVFHYGETPGSVVAATIALYLAVAFVFGLITPSRWGTFSPALGYIAGMWLWILVPGGEGYDDLTYESGWVGALLYSLAPAFILWLVSTTGWNLAGRRKK